MTKASDNIFPKVRMSEVVPTTPASGQTFYLNPSDHKFYRINSSGIATCIEGSSGTTSPLSAKGDLWGYGTGNARVPVGVNGQVLTADSTQDLGVKWATPSTGGSSSGSIWTLDVDKNGSSIAGFTSTVGQWVTEDGYIKQTATSSINGRLRYDTKFITSLMYICMDIQTKNNNGDGRIGIIVGDAAGSGAGAVIYFDSYNDRMYWECDAQWAVSYTSCGTFDVDTWYTIKILVAGGRYTVWKDGVIIATPTVYQQGEATYVALYTYHTVAWYRNLKIYTLSGSLP